MWEHVYKPRRRVNGKLRVARCYKGRYRVSASDRPLEIALKTSDRGVAMERLHAIVQEKRNEAAGIIAPKALRDGAAKSLDNHLRDLVADLKARGRDSMYVRNVAWLSRRVFTECGWVLPKDVTADGFVTWRARAAKSLAAKTLNEYLNSLNALLNWMRRQGRIIDNPLRSVGKVETRGVEKRVRRALTDEEFGRLLAVSPLRRVVYLAAWLTGLRRAELAALTWGDVHLDAPRPFMRVRASTTKNHLAVDLLLRDDLAAALRLIRPAAVADLAGVFTDRLPDMETFRVDLAAAKIPEVDARGRVVDFHGFRHTLATNLNRGGVTPRVAQKLMRHSDLRLTMNVYTDPELLDTEDAYARLARFDEIMGEAVQATGTDGRVLQNLAKHDTQKDTQARGVGGRFVSQSVREKTDVKSENHQQNQGEYASAASDVTPSQNGRENWGTRIRTSGNAGELAPDRESTHKKTHTDRDLELVLIAWPNLPETVRASVAALVRAFAGASPPARPKGEGREE